MSVAGLTAGKTGLEKRLDEEIIGQVGFQRYEVNAFGKELNKYKLIKVKQEKILKLL